MNDTPPAIGTLTPSSTLTPGEKHSLDELLQSRGWTVFTKLLQELLGQYGRFCINSRDDIRFWQGAYQALEAVLQTPELRLQLAEQIEQDQPEVDLEELFRQNQANWLMKNETTSY